MPRVAIVGGGVAGLTAAWDLVNSGWQVDLYEASSELGGAVAPHTLAGVKIDAGAEAFSTRSVVLPQLIKELGLQGQVVSPTSAEPGGVGAWLQLPDLAAPLPATGILGIPADPLSEDVIRILGEEAARRAAQDFEAPITEWSERVSAEQPLSLGEVVRSRMGQPVLDRLVTPISSGVYSASADDLDIRTAAPGLIEAMLEEGSLARAVARLKAQAPAGSAVQSLRGGMSTLTRELERQLRARGVRFHMSTEVEDLAEVDIIGTGVPGPDAPAEYHGAYEEQNGSYHVEVYPEVAQRWPDHIILAVDGEEALRLAAPYAEIPTEVPSGFPAGTTADTLAQDTQENGTQENRLENLGADGGPRNPDALQRRDALEGTKAGVALVSMVLDAPELDSRPRGTGMLVAPAVSGVGAKAMTHASAKWRWVAERLRESLGEGHHLVRLSYGRVTDSAESGNLGYASTDQELLSAAARDVGELFGMPIGSGQILDADVVRWQKSLPRTAAGHQRRVEGIRTALEEQRRSGGPSIFMIGTWFAGTGLARVIPDARATARRIIEGTPSA